MKKVYFLSDLHLGDSIGDAGHDAERSAVRFLDSIADDAAEIYLLGDVLDYWFEYRHVVPRGFVRFFGKLAELSDRGINITWLIGNHDIWIFDYLPQELGIEVVDGMIEREIMGVKFCLQHGDAIGGTRKFRILRAFFRNPLCQKLYSGIHPRWTVGFAFNCSKKSRVSKPANWEKLNDLLPALKAWCERRIAQGDDARYYVFGHLHRAHDIPLPEGRTLIVVPDWSLQRGYGVFDGQSFKLYTREGK